nr:hypothetical protein [uncultured Methanobacterium sp.]
MRKAFLILPIFLVGIVLAGLISAQEVDTNIKAEVFPVSSELSVGDTITVNLNVINSGPSWVTTDNEKTKVTAHITYSNDKLELLEYYITDPNGGRFEGYNQETGNWIIDTLPSGWTRTLVMRFKVIKAGGATISIDTSCQTDHDPSNNAATINIKDKPTGVNLGFPGVAVLLVAAGFIIAKRDYKKRP